MCPETLSQNALTTFKLVKQACANPTELTPESASEAAGYCRNHLDRVFSRLLGETVSTLLVRLRLERAAAELVHSSLSIGAIGWHAGYGSPEAFAKEFKKLFGLAPSTFRRRTDRVPDTSSKAVHWQDSSERTQIAW